MIILYSMGLIALWIAYVYLIKKVLCVKCYEYKRLGPSTICKVHESSFHDEYVCKECKNG